MLYISYLKVIAAIIFGFSAPTPISKSQLIKIHCINEISSELPTDIKVYSLSLVAQQKGEPIYYNNVSIVNLADLSPEGCDVKQEVRDFLEKIDIGKKVYFDIKYQRENENYPRSAVFAFLVTE